MKKSFYVLFVFVIVVVFAGCDNVDSNNGGSQAGESAHAFSVSIGHL